MTARGRREGAPAIPSIRQDLGTLILRALKEPVETGSIEDSPLLDRDSRLSRDLTSPGSGERIEVLDQISLEGRKVLDLGAGLGDVSRAARRGGAALVDGLEQNPDLVTLARLLNAYHRVTRVSFHHRDMSLPTSYAEHYDVVLAFSALPILVPVLDRIAGITDGVFLTGVPAFGSSDKRSALLDQVEASFPFHETLKAPADSAAPHTRRGALLLWAKSEAALEAALQGAGSRRAPRAGRHGQASRNGGRKRSAVGSK